MTKHLTEEDLVLLYYGEAEARADGPGHLRVCAGCREAAEGMARMLDACSEWIVPEPRKEMERGVWARLAPQLEDRGRRGGISRWQPIRLWLAPVAVLAMLLCAFWLGRFSLQEARPPEMTGLSDAARQRILTISLADHLDRAGILLTEIANTGEANPAGISEARYRARDMVEDGRIIRLALSGRSAGKPDGATLAMLDEVERFLLEMAHAPEAGNRGMLRSLQGRIEAESLLFKVRVIESNLRTEGRKS